jgi:PAS domain S-box-containing protein
MPCCQSCDNHAQTLKIEKYLADIINLMSDGVVLFDKNNIITYCNPSLAQVLKSDVQNLIGQSGNIIFPEESFTVFKQYPLQSTAQYELKIKNDNGTEIDISVLQNPYYDNHNELIGRILIITENNEQQRLKKKLAESEKRFLDIAGNTADLIWELDAQARFSYVNSMVHQILGFSDEEIIGKHWHDLSIESEKIGFQLLFKDLFENRHRFNSVQGRFRHKNGQEVFLEMSGLPVWSGSGEFIAYRGISRDITIRKLAEQAQQRKNKYDLKIERCVAHIAKILFQSENIDDALTQSLSFTLNSFNLKYSYIYKLDENLKAFSQYCLGSQGQKLMPHKRSKIRLNKFYNWLTQLQNNDVVHIDDLSLLFNITKSEQRFLARCCNSAFILVPIFVIGKFYGFIGFEKQELTYQWNITEIVALRTITENISKAIGRKQVREESLQQQLKFESVVKSSTEGIILIDEKGTINLINPAAKNMLACLTNVGLTGKIMNLGDISITQTWIDILKDNLNSFRQEIGAINSSGRSFLVIFSVVRNAENCPTGLIINLHETTEMRQAQEQLMQSSKLASLGMLAAGVAHELNNPLTSVIGYAQLLLMQTIPDNIKELIDPILDEGQRAKHIIENMLEFSYQQHHDRELIDINKTIHQTAKLLGKQLSFQNIRLIEKFEIDLPLVYGDKGQLQQVFLNIIQNAYDAMILSHIFGDIIISTQLSTSDKIQITFMDTGPGMPEEVRQKVFDPFFTTKAPGSGTGLGLSISFKIIQQHEGTISVKSEIGKGTTFFITLPIKFEQIPNSAMSPFSQSSEKRKSAKIVYIINKNQTDQLMESMKNTIHKVYLSDDIMSSIFELCEGHYDLMMVDLKMLNIVKKGLTEYNLTDWKKRIIFLASHEINSNVMEPLIQQHIHCIAKTSDPVEILELISKIIEEKELSESFVN